MKKVIEHGEIKYQDGYVREKEVETYFGTLINRELW